MTTPAATPASASPAPPASGSAPGRTPLRGRLAVVSVMLGIFSIVTTEILPIGLLTSIGADFDVSDGTAGLMMTMPGLLAAVSAPVVTVATARVDRRLMLGAFVLLLALADFLTAAATDYRLILVARVMVGVTIGGFWSIGSGLAGRLVRPASAGRATAVIFSAVPLGSVLGVPAGTFLGGLAGWRTAFVVMGLLSVGVLALMLLVVPPLPPTRVTRASLLRTVLNRPGTLFALLLTFLVVPAHFATYTYVTPFLERVTHAGPTTITVFLLVYGAAGIVGNFAGGALVTRRPRTAVALAAGLIATATVLLPVLGRWEAGAVALLAVWGVAYGAVPVCSQTWFTRAAPDAPEAASVLFTAFFQAAFALGALAGGAGLDHLSVSAVMLLGGATAALAVVAAVAGATRGRPGGSGRLG
ncbi:MFS transporter [Streptomyces sp. NPDC057697]|uniref:MFS transporter n=1 Tax=Streptomyces sp. NPDC057697 TaxID=3346219 RepID=UPI0036994AAA